MLVISAAPYRAEPVVADPDVSDRDVVARDVAAPEVADRDVSDIALAMENLPIPVLLPLIARFPYAYCP